MIQITNKFLLLLLLFISNFLFSQNESFQTSFEKNSNSTPTYEEVIAFYKDLAKEYDELELQEWGMTDAGYPLHTVVLSLDKVFDPVSIKDKNKRVFFINNAIHPGEPCGVDATMMLFRDILQGTDLQSVVKDVVLVAIPIYNIGGALNRGSFSRTNQNGPEAYGFRGNAKNLDLNRDFIKCDSKNAQTFNQVFTYWQPDVFVDNHTSNGADYQYTMTLIATQKDKLDPHLSEYMNGEMLPRLYKEMAAKKWEMTPYVNVRNTPDEGIAAFLDLPRYSSGYAALHNCLSFTSEAHMLKPYKNRVLGTYALMESLIETIHDDSEKIASARKKSIQNTMEKDSFDLNWALNMEQKETFLFKGYEAKYKPSMVTGLDRLWYDHDAPYEKEIPFFNTYKTTAKVSKPVAYILPKAYVDVIERLNWNGVSIQKLSEDKIVEAEFYYIKDFKTRNAYEGHYLHSKVEVEKETMNWQYYKGDYVIFVNQPSNRYLVETLEPQGADSYFAWNFFEGILQQKEYFSSYVFEDLATEYLDKNPDLKRRLAAKRAEDEKFAKSAWRQLEFVYQNSPHYERTHRLYPVARIVKDLNLPVE
ncbi:MAG: M14 family metallopeptidase [Bacteroidetes bacterium]|jgi:hypothetical protein|nr:M14 family metallopeptidase [Bacteroidota bacterium]MDF1863451.1 M14 family metallopeptidase [Saprospiraceae bacterium]